MHDQRKWMAGAYTVGIVACFLPWMHAPIIGTVSGTQGDGQMSVVAFAIALALVLLGERGERISGWRSAVAQVFGVLGSLVTTGVFYKISQMKAQAQENPFTAAMANAVGTDIGLYVALVAGFVGVAAARKGSKSDQVTG